MKWNFFFMSLASVKVGAKAISIVLIQINVDVWSNVHAMSSAHDVIVAIGKVHTRSAPSLSRLP